MRHDDGRVDQRRGVDRLLVASRWLMAVFYVASGANHFLRPDLHVGILPPALPLRLSLVLASGALAIGLGLLLLVPRWRRVAAWGIVLLLVVLLPVHVYMVLHPDVLPAIPPWVLWLRLPLQLVLVAWAAWHGVHDPPPAARPLPATR